MKTTYKKAIQVLTISTVAILLFASCGGDGGSKFGIDGQEPAETTVSLIPKCVGDNNDAVDNQALLVPSGTKITKNSDNASLRIWHFQNSSKAVCVISGEAIVEVP